MELKPKQDLLRIAVIQFCILNIAWGFYAIVRVMNPLPLPDATAVWVYQNPTETTLVVTMVATVLSSITLSCFTQAAKHALKQYIGTRKSISLANLSIGVALASATFTFKRKPRYLGPTFVTLAIAIAFGLVNSAWTTYLSPVQVNMYVAMTGEELDLGSPAFDAVLGKDMNATFGFVNGTLVTPPISANSLGSVAYTGGLTSAGSYASGQPGILNFNNVTFSVSTGGILSAVKEYGSESTLPMPASGTPASFIGGSVPTNLTAHDGLHGISRTYNISQQGLTAKVSCYNYTNPADFYPIQVQSVSVNATYQMDGFVSGIFPVSNTTLPRLNCNPNISNEGMIASMAAVNFNNSNYLASVVCPYTWEDAQTADRIVVYHSGVGKYAALPPTICEITLLLTESSVLYANQLVTPVVHRSRPIPNQHSLNFWVTLLVELEEWGFQTARVNSLGNMLFSLLASGAPAFSETPVLSYQLFLQEFWRGLIEVTGTALRSGYTAYPQNVTAMRIPMKGTRNITTMGWAVNNKTRKLALVPIMVTAAMTFAAIAFAWHHIQRSERLGELPAALHETTSRDTESASLTRDTHLGRLVVPHSAIGTFDASDPTHLLVASAARHPDRGVRDRRYWEQWDENVVVFQMQRGG